MYVTALNALASEISTRHLSNDEICKHLALSTFGMLGTQACYMATVDEFGIVHTTGKFGFQVSTMDSWHLYPLTDTIPSTDAIKFSKIIWENNLPTWSEKYSDLNNYDLLEGAASFVAWPILKGNTAIGSMGFFSNHILSPSNELENFFITVGRLVALHLELNSDVQSNLTRPKSNSVQNLYGLTERQRDVLKFISNGSTNEEIGLQMGFSTGTVRLETIKIYKLLGVTNRFEAAEIFNRLTSEVF